MAKRKKQLSDLTSIELYSPSLDRTDSFKKDHASKMLMLSAKGMGDWKLVNEQLEYDKENGITTRSDQKITEGAEEASDNTEG